MENCNELHTESFNREGYSQCRHGRVRLAGEALQGFSAFYRALVFDFQERLGYP